MFRYRFSLALAFTLEAELAVEAQVVAERTLVDDYLLAADVTASDAERQSDTVAVLALLLEQVYELTHQLTACRSTLCQFAPS